ncbi:hypothetical protein [Knoellia sp. Soil729]|uniref:hypothetical protein n=1 Tax=Knoellia sp. Soil729 TaxID=1736394 RepID=UPI0006FB0FA1|nr:hypothetical protein [Knoellia sp. Soil729]
MTITTRSFSAALAAVAVAAGLGACGSTLATSPDTAASAQPAADTLTAKVGDEVDFAAVFQDTAAAMKATKSYSFTGNMPEGLKATVVEIKDGTTTYESTLSTEQQLALAQKRLEDMGMGDAPMPTPTTAMKPITVRQSIGADNLPTKVELVGDAGSTMTLTYSGWGEPVDVTAPAADSVASFSELR